MKSLKKETLYFYNIVKAQVLLTIIFFFIIKYMKDDFSFPKDNTSENIKIYYYSVVTQFSVGYGDIVPLTDRARVVNIMHIFLAYYLLATDFQKTVKVI
jgi:hypothetical protein